MKYVIVIIAVLVAALTAGYFALPFLISQQTADMRTELSGVMERLLKVEEFVRAEQKMRMSGGLQSDADLAKVIGAVNVLSSRLNKLQQSQEKGMETAVATIEEGRAETQDKLKKQAETMDRMHKNVQDRLRRVQYEASLESARLYILKVYTELQARNTGTASSEFDLVNEAFKKAKVAAPEDDRKAIESLQSALKKAQSDLQNDIPAAMNRINLLWHEVGALMRKA